MVNITSHHIWFAVESANQIQIPDGFLIDLEDSITVSNTVRWRSCLGSTRKLEIVLFVRSLH